MAGPRQAAKGYAVADFLPGLEPSRQNDPALDSANDA
jgi:hypothetical protein